MSLKLLIADDEYFIRQRIKKIIPWEKLNLTFAGEAENGQQVIDHLEKEPVDLLLLDIKMPQMNGIETARYIKEHFPSVHMLILSGYNDFEYARTAIRYGVKEYLLKPVAAEELERALSECIQAIHFEEQTRHTLKHYEHFHLCSMLANIRDGVLSYSDLCVQHPEFEIWHTASIAVSMFRNTLTMQYYSWWIVCADRIFSANICRKANTSTCCRFSSPTKKNYSISEVVLRILLHSKTNIHFCILKISFLLQPTGSHITPAACTF